jgi:hypothetical protein
MKDANSAANGKTENWEKPSSFLHHGCLPLPCHENSKVPP